MKIYTKTGDTGETGLFGGPRVSKDHLRIQAYGTVDELNSTLGVALVHCSDEALREMLLHIQHQLFVLGADLATPLETKSSYIQRIPAEAVTQLEQWIDQFEAELPPLTHFILPGGSICGAFLHQARTVCRRAERYIIALSHEASLSEFVIPYINRLSDYLFDAARIANVRAGTTETIWNSNS
ncbi:MAG: cob(I)yrinic acid a,c-diamide adenosyltransferase [Gemmatimonadetes bacterium]|nr:MAG: cob(I)yrinic acid a,c-diamide adenosyltransferase [Gemmatimonadota bacterium]